VRRAAPQARARPAAAAPGGTLDGSWDRRLAAASSSPTPPSTCTATTSPPLRPARRAPRARHRQGARLLLLITGKPPTDDRRPVGRGAIRAAVGDWLHASRHAAAIAAVRGAHPRHGGSGALYIVLRRRR
jgi:hypothetical protein